MRSIHTFGGAAASSSDLSSALPELKGRRIIMVVEHLAVGGAEQQAFLLARHLVREEGAHVEVWAFKAEGPMAKRFEDHGIQSKIIALSWSWRRSQRLRSLCIMAWALHQARPDIILAYTMLPNLICGMVWRFTRARVFIWNQRDEGLGRLGGVIEKLAVRLTPWFVSNSRAGAEFLIQRLAAKPGRVRVIRNGIEVPTVPSGILSWRNQLGISEECFLACMVAKVDTLKDQITLLKAWRRVVDRMQERGRTTTLILAGRLAHRSDMITSLASELALGSTLRFLGEINDVKGLLTVVDLGVFSSKSEGCPNGVLECMAAGLAIAGSDIPGIREAMGSNYPFLAPPGDANSLAEKILELAEDDELRARTGAENRLRVEREFALKGMCEAMVALMRAGSSAARHA